MNLQLQQNKHKRTKNAEEQYTALYCRLSCEDEHTRRKIQTASS